MKTRESSPQRGLERAGAIWETVLAQVPTTFGKLLWVASFRVPGQDRYRHPALDQMFSPEIADCVLRESHRRQFQRWLEIGLQEQHDDFLEYVDCLHLSRDPRDLLNTMEDRLVPASTAKPHELLFDTDLAVVRELLG